MAPPKKIVIQDTDAPIVSTSADVPIREYVNLKMIGIYKDVENLGLIVSHNREMVEEITEQQKEARELKAAEYDRRLDALNHEAERLALMVPKDMFDEVCGGIRKEITILQLWRANQEGKAARSQLIAVASALLAMVAVTVSIIKLAKGI